MSDRIIVMYLGVIAEVGKAEDIFRDPRHPYTEALLAANPSMHGDDSAIRLPGSVPDPAAPPEGCRFHTRCPVATERCGWDVSDVLRILDERGRLLDGLRGVQRRTPFDATLSFETDDQAAAVAKELTGDRVAASLRTAAELVEARDRDVRVRFVAVEEMSVVAVGEDHHTACILHAEDAQAARS
jgi:oligopeptide/dipeptide ABC transporter ATP-binding protein